MSPPSCPRQRKYQSYRVQNLLIIYEKPNNSVITPSVQSCEQQKLLEYISDLEIEKLAGSNNNQAFNISSKKFLHLNLPTSKHTSQIQSSR